MSTDSTTTEIFNLSPPSPPLDLGDISEKTEALRNKRSQQNELTPIYQLPPEVLGTTFEFVITECSHDPAHERVPPPIWFNFAYVSQRWRNVALNTPQVWGVLLFNYPKWVTATLQRSRGADLAIHINWNRGDSMKSMEEVFERHVLRIRRFHVSVAVFGLSDLSFGSFLQYLKHSSLSLHSFRLIGSPFHIFPANTFSETCRMRYLNIRGSVRCLVGPFPDLIHLRIQGCICPFLDQFLRTLEEMPGLEVLELDGALPVNPSAILSPLPVALPKLRSLNLHSITRSGLDVVPFLVIPSTATINLSALSQESSSRGLGYVSYNSIHIRCPNCNFIVEVWDNGAGISGLQLLRLNWSIPGGIVSPLPTYNLTTLTLHISISTSELIKRFGSLPFLRNIVVSGQSVFNVIFALMHEPLDDDAFPASYSVTFPALQSLLILAMEYTSSVVPRTEVDLMLRCFMARRERDVNLDELELLQCENIDESHVKLLREVRWDKEGRL